MDNQHNDDHEDLTDAITDVIWGWLTRAVAKVRGLMQKARRERE